MLRNYLVRACRAILGIARAFAGATAAGVVPDQAAPTAVRDNIAWGQRFIAAAVVSALTGESMTVGRVDLIMLALFLASVVVARRWQSPVIVYQATQATSRE